MPLMAVVRSLFSLSAFLACDSLLQSSRPLQAWDSSIRCFWQKWPLQKSQSPMMRWAGSLQSLKLQRGLRGGILEGLFGEVLGGDELERGRGPRDNRRGSLRCCSLGRIGSYGFLTESCGLRRETERLSVVRCLMDLWQLICCQVIDSPYQPVDQESTRL